jgi:hypothetical protein
MSELTLFDVNEIVPTGQVIQATERIKLRLKRTAEDIIAIGQDLTLIKAELGHGHFLPWIEKHFEMKRHTAQNFMNVAERFGSNGEIFTISPSILYELASPSTPETVIQEVTAKVEAGEVVSVKEVQELKRQAKEAQADKERLQRELNVNKQANEFLKKDLSDMEVFYKKTLSERDALQELLNEPAPEPVVKVVEKEIEVIKEVPMIPEGFSSVQEAIEAKQAELRKIEQNYNELVDKRRQQDLDIREMERSIQDKPAKRIAFVCFGPMLYTAMEVAEAIDATVVNMRFIKPLDEDLLKTIASSHDGIVFVEDSCVMGGAGSACLEYLAEQDISVSALQIGLPDQFTEHGDIPSLMDLYGISAKQIEARVRTRFAIEACTTAP